MVEQARGNNHGEEQEGLREARHHLAVGVSCLMLAMRALGRDLPPHVSGTHELARHLLSEGNNGHPEQKPTVTHQDAMLLNEVGDWFNDLTIRAGGVWEQVEPTDK